jgi:hypothetical protein
MNDADTTHAAHGRERLARAFLALGRIGFWVQFIFLIVVVILGLYVFAITGSRARIGNMLAFLGLALPVFTTWWCWHYAQFGRRLGERDDPAPLGAAARKAWIGVWAGSLGVVVSLLSLFGAASALLIVMLANPQVGIQISPASGAAAAYTVSAVDALSIMSLLLTLTAEILVVVLSLRLVFLVAAAARSGDTE